MNYGYEGAAQSSLIKKFMENGNDNITITYLDGHTNTIPFSEEVKEKLYQQLLKQAIERNNSDALMNAKEKRKWAASFMIGEIIMILLAPVAILTNKSEKAQLIAGIAGSILTIDAVVNGHKFKMANEEIKEIKKYAIYLKMRDKIEQNTDQTLFCGVKDQEQEINLNNIDEYSFAKIKRLNRNHQVQKLANNIFTRKAY